MPCPEMGGAGRMLPTGCVLPGACIPPPDAGVSRGGVVSILQHGTGIAVLAGGHGVIMISN
jgi:hypothetical protein